MLSDGPLVIATTLRAPLGLFRGSLPEVARRLDTRERILDSACLALVDGGPTGASIAKIMAALGRTHGGFYLHFASKDDLIAAAVKRILDSVEGRFREVIASAREGRAAAIAQEFIDPDSGSHALALALTTVFADAPRYPPPAQAALREGLGRITAVLAGALRSTEPRADIDADAALLLKDMLGAGLFARVAGSALAARACRRQLQTGAGARDA